MLPRGVNILFLAVIGRIIQWGPTRNKPVVTMRETDYLKPPVIGISLSGWNPAIERVCYRRRPKPGERTDQPVLRGAVQPPLLQPLLRRADSDR
jgi:hypothetical protein